MQMQAIRSTGLSDSERYAVSEGIMHTQCAGCWLVLSMSGMIFFMLIVVLFL